MLSAAEIRNIKFTKSMSGYKQEEVDILLDKVESDYEQYDRIIKELQSKVAELNSDIETYKGSQNSIQNVLLSAQKLADQIVDEAKAKSAEIVKNAESNIAIITAREKELATAFEIKANDRKAELEREITSAVTVAKAKAESVTAAAEDSVARQQILFDKLKLEVAAFKADITKTYKEHLEVLQKLPDSVSMDPKQMAVAVSAAIDKEPDIESYIKPRPVTEENVSDAHGETAQESDSGFVISDIPEDSEPDGEDNN